MSNAALLESNPDAGCSAGGVAFSACSRACASSADCAGLGTQPVCSVGCTGRGLCFDQGTGAPGGPR